MDKRQEAVRLNAIIAEEITGLLQKTQMTEMVVAYSGGLDSSVLLHLLATYCRTHPELTLRAIHINHNLHSNANTWEAHCKANAQRLGVAFNTQQMHLPTRSNLEATARKYRYQALGELMTENSLLCTAHHRNDQAETLLLNMLRGTGTKGMVGIHRLTRLDKGWLARPMLGISRQEIDTYAQAHKMEWQEDPSNSDLHYARNYIRHCIAPALQQRWPQWDASFARSAEHHAEIQPLIESETQQWLQGCLVDGKHLSRKACRALPDAYRNLVLRCWMEMHHIAMPSARNLTRLRKDLIEKDARNGAAVEWKNAEFRFYRGLIYSVDPQRCEMPDTRIQWDKGADIDLPNGMHLKWQELVKQMPDLQDDAVKLCFRTGRENSDSKYPRHKIKKAFQEHGIPPWEREYIPLIYTNSQLLVWKVQCIKQSSRAVI